MKLKCMIARDKKKRCRQKFFLREIHCCGKKSIILILEYNSCTRAAVAKKTNKKNAFVIFSHYLRFHWRVYLHFLSSKGMASDLWMTSLHEWMWNQKRCIKVSLWLIPFSSESDLPVMSFQTLSASREDRLQQSWHKVQSASTVDRHPASAVSLVSSRTN